MWHAYTTWGGVVNMNTIFSTKVQRLRSKFLHCLLRGFLLIWLNHFICGIHTHISERFVAHNFKDERSKIKVTRVVHNSYHGRRVISWLLGETDQLCWYLVAKACRSYEIPGSTDLCYYQNIYPGKKYSLLYQYPFYMLSHCIQSYDDARHCYEYRMWFIHEILLLN